MTTKLHLLIAGMLLAAFGTGLGQPIITNQPQDQTNFVGTTATFTVGATGSGWSAYPYVTNSENCIYIESLPTSSKFYRLHRP